MRSARRSASREAQTRRVFAAARAHGLPVKLHADQLSDAGGAALAAEFGALSADHLEYTSDAGVAAMARAGTVAVLLPGAFHPLRETQVPPIAALRAHGVPMAVATDCNPGTSPSTSLPLMLNMACTLFRLTPEEALAGVTRHAARALGLARPRHARRGTAGRHRALGYRVAGGALLLDRRQSLPGHRARGGPRRRALGRRPNDTLRDRARRFAARRRRSACGNLRARRDCGAAHAGRAVGPRHGLARREAVRVRARGGRDARRRDAFALRRRSRTATRAAPRSIPGADNTELCPTRTFADEPIYAAGSAPDRAEVAARRAEYFEPYHALLAAEIERVRSRHGYAILLDGHSILSRVPRFFAGRLPDLNLGTADGASCAPAVQSMRGARARRRRGLFQRRERPLQGRLHHAPLRRAGARRPRAPARDGAGVLHGRGAALSVGARARGRRSWRCCGGSSRRSSPIRPAPITMQRIFIASHRVEAYLLVDRLAHAGIKAHVFNEHASSIVGEVPPDVAQPQVWLDDDADRAVAEAILRAYQEERNRAGSHRLRQVRRGESGDVRAVLEVRLVALARVRQFVPRSRGNWRST